MAFVPENYPDKNICILGLGYVGLTLATVMAEVGFQVQGVEIREDVLNLLKTGTPHFYEPGLNVRLRKVISSGKLLCSKHITSNFNAKVYIITVGTPLGANGRVRLNMIENVSREISQYLTDDNMVIMRSTVKLGTTRNVVLPILQESGAKFDLAFCPERTIEGKALNELRQLPQITGGIDINSTLRASHLFQFLTPTIVRVSDVETAEMIKMIDNSSRDVSFAYANEVARICDVVGVSAAEVIKAGKLGYERVNLPMPGTVGGPCLVKDPYILAEGLESHNIEPEITLASRKINERQPEEIIRYLYKLTESMENWPSKPIITLMGIAFKGRPATDDLRGTMAIPIIECVKKYFPDTQYKGYDAMVSAENIRNLGLEPYDTIESAFENTNLAIIMNNHPVFSEMAIEQLANCLAKPGLIYDFWNNFIAQDLNFPNSAGYISIGSHGKAILPWRNKI